MSLLTYGELFCGKELLLGNKGQEMTSRILTQYKDTWISTEYWNLLLTGKELTDYWYILAAYYWF